MKTNSIFFNITFIAVVIGIGLAIAKALWKWTSEQRKLRRKIRVHEIPEGEWQWSGKVGRVFELKAPPSKWDTLAAQQIKIVTDALDEYTETVNTAFGNKP